MPWVIRKRRRHSVLPAHSMTISFGTSASHKQVATLDGGGKVDFEKNE
jgi:hypothetical protein